MLAKIRTPIHIIETEMSPKNFSAKNFAYLLLKKLRSLFLVFNFNMTSEFGGGT